MRGLARRLALALAAPLVLLGLWLALALLGWPGPRLVPAPALVASLAAHELTHAALWRDVGATLARVVIGVGVASALGAGLGFALGRSRRWRAASEPSIDFLRSIPPILTFPLFLLGLGYGERARLATVVFGCAGIVLLHVAAGLAAAPRERAEAVRLMGLGRLATARHLELPEALPGLILGVRVALATGLVIVIVTELLIGAPHGLGVRAREAQIAYQPAQLWLVIALSGALGALLSGLLARLGRRLTPWCAAPSSAPPST
ncbi:MAG: ABC transporter permease subunit [Deltaproteobacteria bacterium]|nr:ABC transporter permease subunit [Deltaproteobacteria bacterium]